jgi:SAM-dependent methyltransferase
METRLAPVAPATVECKCCGAGAKLYGVVDFSKNCEVVRNPRVLGLSGVPVYYHRCDRCGFLFTAAFDDFSDADFARHIYNEEYVLVDPDFPAVRPRGNADMVAELFGRSKDLRILDFGGGNGLLATLLREKGFQRVDTYDPFVPEHAARPAGTYDLILCFEVVEHAPNPASTFAEISSLLERNGMVIFSTLLQPDDIASFGVDWWYVAPRNGHVSLHSTASLARLTEPLGFNYGAFHQGLHVLFRELPSFASHLV